MKLQKTKSKVDWKREGRREDIVNPGTDTLSPQQKAELRLYNWRCGTIIREC